MTDRTTNWEFKAEVRAGERFGRPLNERGKFLAREMPSQEFIAKAISTMGRLFSVMDDLNIVIEEDSEQEVVLVCFDGEQFDVIYRNKEGGVDKFEILSRHGYLVGSVVRVDNLSGKDIVSGVPGIEPIDGDTEKGSSSDEAEQRDDAPHFTGGELSVQYDVQLDNKLFGHVKQ